MSIISQPASDPRASIGRHPHAVAKPHLAGITGLRGVAAWWVVLYHFRELLPEIWPASLATTVDHGYLAVDLFFILSGFIIAYNYLSDFPNIDKRRYLRFLGVRLARIYPLHIFMLAVFLLNPLAIMLASRVVDHGRYAPIYFVESIFLVQNWGFTHSLSWNVPAWSISTEWFAYLGFPLIAWGANRISRGIASALIASLLPLAMLAVGLYSVGDTLGGRIDQNGLFRCVTEFMAGVFLYQLWRRVGHLLWLRLSALVLSIGLLALYCGSDLDDFWLVPLAWTSLIYAVAAGQTAVRAIFAGPIVELVGTWSYSTYLVHYFVRDWIKFLLIHDGTNPWIPLVTYLVATAVASVVLYHFVEVPGRALFRAHVDRFTRRLAPGVITTHL